MEQRRNLPDEQFRCCRPRPRLVIEQYARLGAVHCAGRDAACPVRLIKTVIVSDLAQHAAFIAIATMSLRPHVFMDEAQYRSAATIHYGFNIAIPPNTSSYGYGNYRTASYTDPTSDWYAGDAAWQQRIRQIYLEQSGARWYTDRMIQRYIPYANNSTCPSDIGAV